MIRSRTRLRWLYAVLAVSLVLESVGVVVCFRRFRSRVASEVESLRLRVDDCVSNVVVTASLVADALRNMDSALSSMPSAASAESDAAPPAPTRRVRGRGQNGRYFYLDVETDYHDGEPPSVERVYRRLPDELRPERFRAKGAGVEPQ